MTIVLSRRAVLGSLAAMSALPITTARAQNVGNKKFVFIILRGAMDGLAALIPDDAETQGLRGRILPAQNTRLNLGNGFRLHPSFEGLNGLYKRGEAAFVHAAATHFRSRSHFDAQDALEILGQKGGKTGWLNRAVGRLNSDALAVGYALPLAATGPAHITNWAPAVFPDASEALIGRLESLYANDPIFSKAMEDAMGMEAAGNMMNMRGNTRKFDTLTKALGKFMAADNGPNIGMVSLDGWDTHANQAKMLTTKFKQLDDALIGLKSELGSAWRDTCVMVCSEFGRTVKANGSNGSDHGTGGLVMLLGGSVKGGKVHGDWPGLKSNALFEGRDLYPANDIGAITGGILRDHLGLGRSAILGDILPETPRIMSGLIA